MFWTSGGTVDTPVLGTGLERGEGSSPFSPTRKSNNSENFCCTSCCIGEDLLHNEVRERLGLVGFKKLVSLRNSYRKM